MWANCSCKYTKCPQRVSIVTLGSFAAVSISWRLIAQKRFWGCHDLRRQLFGTFDQADLETQARRKTQGFLPNTWGLDTHRHSKTSLRNLRGQLCLIQGLTSNGSPGKVVCCIVCWFVGCSLGGCHGDCLHFLSVAAHIKGCVLVSIIVTNWILHFPRTHVTNLQQSERMSERACVYVCLCPCMCMCAHRRGWQETYKIILYKLYYKCDESKVK